MVKKIEKEKTDIGSLISILIWFVGIIVTLSVGAGMVKGTLNILPIPLIVTQVAGWTVIVISIISVILSVFSK
jgi:hypothetical protein